MFAALDKLLNQVLKVFHSISQMNWKTGRVPKLDEIVKYR